MTSRSRTLRWTLGGMLAVVILAGGVMSLWHAARVDAACAAIRGMNASVWIEPAFPDWLQNRLPGKATTFLKSWFGRSFVSEESMSGGIPAAKTEAARLSLLEHARRLPHVVSIHLEPITPEAATATVLARLSAFEELESLYLDGMPITDDDLTALPPLPNLKSLSLDWTQVTGSGLADLARLPKLASLSLDGTPLTQDALFEIARLKGLTSLSVSNVGLPESSLMELESHLPGVMISDD